MQIILPAPQAADLTEQYRQAELKKGETDFYYFVTEICGLVATDRRGKSQLSKLHRELADFLSSKPPFSPYNTAVVCASRGTGKSVWVRMYALWRILYIDNFSVYLISNSYDNAKKHFMNIYRLLFRSRRSEYILWLFSHRFPPDLEGTNTEQIVLVQSDEQADAAFTYGGIESAHEGKHPDMVILDDPEGSDAEKTSLPNQRSFALYEQIQPLLKYPDESQVIVAATPWGRNPLVYQLRDLVLDEVKKATGHPWLTEEDNKYSSIQFFWRPIWADSGETESVWPERFSPEHIRNVLSKLVIFRSQYKLERPSDGMLIFDQKAIVDNFYVWVGPGWDTISYNGFEFDPENIDDSGFVRPSARQATVRLKQLRFYIHMDPLHRALEQRKSAMNKQRPADAAILVCGVAPDGHVFVIDYWSANADINGQIDVLFRLYRKWEPFAVTFESIGAQVWIKSFVEAKEKMDPNWIRPMSVGQFGMSVLLPKLSIRLIEGEKQNQAKEEIYREGLGPWFSSGALHLRQDQTALLTQLQEVMNESHMVDLVDCLGQGPGVWKAPSLEGTARDFALRRAFTDAYTKRKPGTNAVDRTGWKSPGWR